MRIKLEQRWIERLLELPESEHRLPARGHSFHQLAHTQRLVVVFNAQEFEVPAKYELAKIKDVSLRAG